MHESFRAFLSGLLVLLLVACSGDPGSGPVEVKWDRDTCGRCRMVLSDRFHAAQVRHSPEGGRSRVYKFDDIGCAVIWMKDKSWGNDSTTEIWVNDHRTGEWIDARTATYVTGHQTPMEYGLGAQAEATPGSMDFQQAKAYIFKVEQRFNVHGAHLKRSQVERNGAAGASGGSSNIGPRTPDLK